MRHWREQKYKAMEEPSKAHPHCSNIHELMRRRNRSAPLQDLFPSPLSTHVSSKHLLSHCDPGEVIHFHSNQLFQITCACCIYQRKIIPFSPFDSPGDFYLENIYLGLETAVIDFPASPSLRENSGKSLTFSKVSGCARGKRAWREAGKG